MAWIESHQTLARHPKTRKLARLLDVGIPQAIGHLHCLWWWALDYAQDGDLTAFDEADIADAAMWEGAPEVFTNALMDCGVGGAGFLDILDEGYAIHDWDIYAGKLIERRKADAARKKAERRPADNNKPASNKEGTSSGRPADVRGTAHVPYPTVPNPTVPNSTEHTQEATADAAECAFQDFFAEFKRTYPENADGKKPQMSRAMAAARKVPVGDRPLVLLAVKHYSMSSSVQRGVVKYAQGFLNPTFWRDYLEEPTGGKGTNGKNQPKSAREQAIANGFRDAFGIPLEQAFGKRPSGEDEDYPSSSVRQLPRPGPQAG